MTNRPSSRTSSEGSFSSTVLEAKRGGRFNTPKSLATYEHILESAIDIIVTEGYHRTNTARIAAHAEVTRGCMQYYFPTTESVLVAASKYLNAKISDFYRKILLNQKSNDWRALRRAIDSCFQVRLNRHQMAWVELQAASLTSRALRDVLQSEEEEFEKLRDEVYAAYSSVFDDVSRTDYLAGHDLLRLAAFGLPTLVISHDTDNRRRNLIQALKRTLNGLWRLDR